MFNSLKMVKCKIANCKNAQICNKKHLVLCFLFYDTCSRFLLNKPGLVLNSRWHF